ncbi:hypothetical protein N867_15760 [Actinotalea fermentans ATCC 43279 = JCM 9966 = DSM 3133]|nr:hypothetical protein N867_15760 [Actinotalea fermentans ATCC 43279 = JCM 9966 = DSM 3133]
MPVWLEAGGWGLVAGSALVLGSLLAWFARIPQRAVATVMAFGAGVLISALAFELVDEAERSGGLGPTVVGFLGGAVAYVAANAALARRGARHRKRSGGQQPSEADQAGSGAAIAIGALLDGVPESVVLGVSVLAGHGVGVGVLAAVAISNVPEGLASAAGMKQAGRSGRYVFGVWGGIAVVSGLAAAVGALALEGADAGLVATITAVAAGAILAMVADTMIPEAFERTHLLTGLVTSLGFLAAFVIERWRGRAMRGSGGHELEGVALRVGERHRAPAVVGDRAETPRAQAVQPPVLGVQVGGRQLQVQRRREGPTVGHLAEDQARQARVVAEELGAGGARPGRDVDAQGCGPELGGRERVERVVGESGERGGGRGARRLAARGGRGGQCGHGCSLQGVVGAGSPWARWETCSHSRQVASRCS